MGVCLRLRIKVTHLSQVEDKSKTFLGKTGMYPATSDIFYIFRNITVPMRLGQKMHQMNNTCRHIEGILPKGPYLPCVSMAGRALLAGYPRHVWPKHYVYIRYVMVLCEDLESMRWNWTLHKCQSTWRHYLNTGPLCEDCSTIKARLKKIHFLNIFASWCTVYTPCALNVFPKMRLKC